MFLVDTAQGRIVGDDEIKAQLAAEHPYQEWLDNGVIQLADLPDRPHVHMPHDRVLIRQQIFGYTNEELNILLAPMAKTGRRRSARWAPTPRSRCCPPGPRLLFDYFSQLFAQVTNPPLDAIREEVVTSLGSTLGPEGDLLHPGADSCRQIALTQPILDNDELAKLIHINDDGTRHDFRSVVIRGLYPVAQGGRGLRNALRAICDQVSAAIEGGAKLIVLSDRESNEKLRADPVAAAGLRGAPPLGPRAFPHQGGSAGGGRRRPRGAPHGRC